VSLLASALFAINSQNESLFDGASRSVLVLLYSHRVTRTVRLTPFTCRAWSYRLASNAEKLGGTEWTLPSMSQPGFACARGEYVCQCASEKDQPDQSHHEEVMIE
jgi:hypothetical protein